MKRRKFFSEVKDITIAEAFDKFMNAKQAQNKSNETVKYYEDRFEKFSSFLEEKGISHASEITDDCVNEYINGKRKTNPQIKDTTINNNLRAIRAVLYYFMDKGYTENFSIPLVTVRKSPKDGYTLEEQTLLVKRPDPNHCTFPEYRNWVIICHLLASGKEHQKLV